MLTKNKLRVNIHRRFAAATAASLFALTSGSAMAAIVCGPTTNISIPNTFSGVYINFLTGVTGATPAATPGWDFGPWGSSGLLSFFWNGTPATSSGGVAAAAAGPYLLLAAGTPISAASTFSQSAASAQTTALQGGVSGALVGFRFFNESTSAINFGWAEFNTTAGGGFPPRSCVIATKIPVVQSGRNHAVSLQSYSVD